MRILLCHNYYQQRGGEDLSFESEARLLEEAGHEVRRYTVHNDAIKDMSRMAVAVRTFWNRSTKRDVAAVLDEFKPDVMHCTNTFPQISASAYSAAKAARVAVVQSLRNYRHLCPGAYLLRDGRVCEDCLTKLIAWSGIRHGCYRGSKIGSAVVAGASAWHRLIGTWKRRVDLFFTPTEFARSRFVAAGFDEEKIAVKPNFIDPDPGFATPNHEQPYVAYVGRLSPEKGVQSLLNAWAHVPGNLKLKVIGDGELRPAVEAASKADPRIECSGWREHAELLELVGGAQCLVMPSIWYETFGRTIVEAFAKGCPVVASRLGCMRELVKHRVTGLLYEPGSATELAAAVCQIVTDRDAADSMREEARDIYLSQYTAARNLVQLEQLYRTARERAGTLSPLSATAVTPPAEPVLGGSR